MPLPLIKKVVALQSLQFINITLITTVETSTDYISRARHCAECFRYPLPHNKPPQTQWFSIMIYYYFSWCCGLTGFRWAVLVWGFSCSFSQMVAGAGASEHLLVRMFRVWAGVAVSAGINQVSLHVASPHSQRGFSIAWSLSAVRAVRLTWWLAVSRASVLRAVGRS